MYKLSDEEDVNEENQCVICFKFTDKTKVLIPCGHAKYCETCIQKIKNDNCPLCNSKIHFVVKIIN
jgi:hypothetical protein